MAFRRFSALFLLFALLGGGFGLPLADAILYHSTPVADNHSRVATVSASAEPGLQARTQSSTLHLQGCVLWLSGLTGSGIAGTAPTIQVSESAATVSEHTTPQYVLTQTDIALGQSRAPPIA